MPRVADIYDYPPGTEAISNTTISSTAYNNYINDIKDDLNQPRPILAGGTGASSASQARDNLDAEVAMQTVTDYNTHVWETGSFVSASSATGAPVADGIVGTVQVAPSGTTVVQARAVTSGIMYMRTKIGAGAWGAWTVDAGSAAFVKKTGDTMTGGLTITNGTAAIYGFGGNNESGRIYLNSGGSRALIYDGTNYSLPNAPLSTANINATGTVAVTGNITATGTITATAKGHLFGSAGGTSGALGVAATDANIKLYDLGSGNWAGIGADPSGNFWIRAGASGTPIPAMRISSSQVTTFTWTTDVLLTGGPASIGIAHSLGIGCLTGVYGIGFRAGADPSNPCIFINAGGGGVGSIACTASATAYNTSSDGRLKEDLKSFDAGRIVDDTTVYDFAWKSTGERSYGVIAQQANEVYPAAFTYLNEQGEDWWGVDYSKYVPVLLQELKALRARVAELEGKLEAGAQPA